MCDLIVSVLDHWTIFNLKIFNYEDERFLHGDELSVYLNRVPKFVCSYKPFMYAGKVRRELFAKKMVVYISTLQVLMH